MVLVRRAGSSWSFDQLVPSSISLSHHSRVPDYRPIYSNARFVENRGEYIFKPNTESWIRVGQVWAEW
jgi:hypothetical protein